MSIGGQITTGRTCSATPCVAARICWRRSFRSFRQYPLRTAKRYDFEKFAYCVELMAGGRHLTREGLAEIVEVMQTMNRKKPRHELIRILRGHTPDVRDSG